MSEARANLELQVALLEAEVAGRQLQLKKMKDILGEAIPCPVCNGATWINVSKPADPEHPEYVPTKERCTRCKDINVMDSYGYPTVRSGVVFKLE